ncbi:ATP-binding protein [Bacillus pinisoli]|uniref:ATP-binding protein n=1 Tax=Bacillus pinisoli TaxID=2901866 RepID=UPI001FF12E91|nr:ATP-binding protein [Bacillus pinisoli]
MIKLTDYDVVNSHKRCLELYKMNPDAPVIPKLCITKSRIQDKIKSLDDFVYFSRKFMKKLISDLEAIPVLIVISDHEGYILDKYGDPTIKGQVESLGISIGIRFREEELGTNSISLALDLKRPIRMIGTEHFQRVLHQSACFSVPFYHEGRVGGTISVMMAAKDASSFHLGLLLSAVDSIEREVKVNKQNKKLLVLNQVLINSSRNGIIITNEEGHIIEMNPFAENVLLSKKEELLNQSIVNLGEMGSYMMEVLDKHTRFEDVEINISGKILLFDSFPIFDESQQVIGVFGQFRDITERLSLEKQVMASEKLSAIGKISAGLAHEIRNPLTAIMGLLQLFKKQAISNDQTLEKYFQIITSELERIKNLVNQFVLMAKPEQKKISKSKTEMNELIRDIILLMDSQLTNKQVQINFDSKTQTEAYIDSDKIKQVLINIIQNSIDAIDHKGVISIILDTSPKDNGIVIEIKDNGCGMDPYTLDTISTPFFSTKKYGLGLGLSMSYNIIESHQGKITVSSEQGAGTIFTVWLPLRSDV